MTTIFEFVFWLEQWFMIVYNEVIDYIQCYIIFTTSWFLSITEVFQYFQQICKNLCLYSTALFQSNKMKLYMTFNVNL